MRIGCLKLFYNFQCSDMLAVISPAKSLDFSSDPISNVKTIPDQLDRSEQLIKKLRTLSKKKIKELMSISDQLAELNHGRYAGWNTDFGSSEDRAAIQAFKGDVYRGFAVENFTEEDLAYAQDHLQILSGLHGLLKPLDLIKPYRLEMGTKLPVQRKKNLYEFWGDYIATRLNESLESHSSPILINLASNEYFKAIDESKLKYRVIHFSFKDYKNGTYKTLMTYAKLARGAMAAFMMQNRVEEPEGLKAFKWEGYGFNSELSEENSWTFTRRND